MIEYLCDNFPHLGHEIINKMSYSSLTRLMDSSKTIESFVKKGNQYLFIERLNLDPPEEEEKESVPYAYNEIEACNRLLENQGKKQIKHTFIRLFEINCDFEMIMKFLEKANYTITCLELHLNNVFKDSLVFECLRTIKTEKLFCLLLEEYNNDFLEKPLLNNIREFEFIIEEPLSVKLSGTKIRKIIIKSDFFEDDIIEFTQKFLEGTLAVRRFLLYSDVPPHFRQKFISSFENQITEEANDFIRLKSKTEEAFIMMNDSHFFFRSVKTSNREILEKYFNVPVVRDVYGYWDGKFPEIAEDDSFYFEEDNSDE